MNLLVWLQLVLLAGTGATPVSTPLSVPPNSSTPYPPYPRVPTSVPTYCMDPKVQHIFQGRLDACLGSGHSPHLFDELQLLRHSSVADFQAAQELAAFQYFTDKNNPHRRPCGPEADLEYIPLLPLAWKVGFPTRTTCTAGGVCPHQPLSNPHCEIKYLIEDVLKYVQYAKSRSVLSNHISLPFVVTGAVNVKTILGFGMPTQNRRGSAWKDVMWFVGNNIL